MYVSTETIIHTIAWSN